MCLLDEPGGRGRLLTILLYGPPSRTDLCSLHGPEVAAGVGTRAFPEVWWNFKTFILKLHNLFPSQSIFNFKAPRWTP